MKRQPLIIDTPSLQSLRQRYAYALITLLFWVLWFYLWIPVISLVAWLLSADVFYREMIRLDGLYGLLDLLGWYGLVIASIAVFYSGWALYNQFRFRGKNRRQEQPEVEPLELADAFNIEPALILPLQEAKRLLIVHDEQGEIRGIKSWKVRGEG
ncbi:MAG: poly-beta-1,6-N-acetyl-D-glucosamine biosynthesis protein PgaD [Gammaproteobacteria bacterium]